MKNTGLLVGVLLLAQLVYSESFFPEEPNGRTKRAININCNRKDGKPFVSSINGVCRSCCPHDCRPCNQKEKAKLAEDQQKLDEEMNELDDEMNQMNEELNNMFGNGGYGGYKKRATKGRQRKRNGAKGRKRKQNRTTRRRRKLNGTRRTGRNKRQFGRSGSKKRSNVPKRRSGGEANANTKSADANGRTVSGGISTALHGGTVNDVKVQGGSSSIKCSNNVVQKPIITMVDGVCTACSCVEYDHQDCRSCTPEEIREFEEDMEEMDTDMEEMQTEIKEEIGSIQTEMQEEMGSMQTEMQEEIQQEMGGMQQEMLEDFYY